MADAASATFEDLALAVFEHQFDACEPYRRFCLSRDRRPALVSDWCDIPAVPIEAFKRVDLCCALPERLFRSTGTTSGPTIRSRHLLPTLALYHYSALDGLRSFLLPDVSQIRIVSLVPPSSAVPDSSLAQMVAWAFEEFGDPQSEYVADTDRVDFERLVQALRDCETSGHPVCILTTTGALVRFLDWLRERDLTFRLPHSSRLMDTGGDKGAHRRMSRKGVLHACWSAFAIPGYFCVNEYGMAELSSQYYDNVIAERWRGQHRKRRKVARHWVRTQVLDPGTLRPVALGTPGLLCHFDLANAGSAMAVLSEDIGICDEGGLELRGRASGADVRGCSLSAAEWHVPA